MLSELLESHGPLGCELQVVNEFWHDHLLGLQCKLGFDAGVVNKSLHGVWIVTRPKTHKGTVNLLLRDSVADHYQGDVDDTTVFGFKSIKSLCRNGQKAELKRMELHGRHETAKLKQAAN